MSDYKHLHHQTARSKKAQLLREEPRTNDELPDNGLGTPGVLRNMIVKLAPPRGHNGGKNKSRPSCTPVYCLYGDERRGVRKFIEANEEYVASCIADTNNNPLMTNWDDALYRMLLEEWDLRTAKQALEDDE